MIGLHLAEVAPVAPPVIEALPFLLALAGLFFAVGLIKLVHGFVHAMFGWSGGLLGHVPVVGKVAAKPFHVIEQHVTQWLGKAELSLDHYIGLCFHNLAHLVRMFAREIEGLAHDLWMISAVIPGLVTQIVLHHFVSTLLHPIRAAQYLIHRLLHIARVEVARIERTVVHGVYPRIRTGEAALEHVIEWDIPNLRARTRELEREYARLHRWTLRHARTVATAAFVAAVAVAVRRLGMNWVRCRNWKRVGKAVCGLPASRVDGLLAVLVGGLALADYRDLIREMQRVERAAAREVIDLLHAFD